jgi:4-hydroxybenzoate polyprenyltransferase
MSLRTYLELGRVSNLPTVWSNTIAGMVLAGAMPSPGSAVAVGSAASLLYVGGMYLNDAFDAEFDAEHRPERPIPSGQIGRRTVFSLGFSMMAVAVAVMAGWSMLSGAGWHSTAAAIGTAGVIVVYNRWHKNNPAGPLIMGLCRVGVYAMAALLVSPTPSPLVFMGAALLLNYVLGLTYVAKYENKGSLARRWPLVGLFGPLIIFIPMLRGPFIVRSIYVGFGIWLNRALSKIKQGKIPSAVGAMIAGISLLDALLIARYGSISWALVAVGAFGATLAFQRKIAGT